LVKPNQLDHQACENAFEHAVILAKSYFAPSK
jgi:hypothetical protein